jgi:fido (protein-threonine AMPylation protein)
MIPININYLIPKEIARPEGESEAEDKKMTQEDFSTEAPRMDISIYGRKIFREGINFIKGEKTAIDSINRDWKVMHDMDYIISFKKYIPMVAQNASGKEELIYIKVPDLFNRFSMTWDSLEEFLKRDESPEWNATKKQFFEILDIKSASSMDEYTQGKIVRHLLDKMVQLYELEPTDEDAQLVRVAILCNREIPKKLMDELTLNSAETVYTPVDQGSRPYKKLVEDRMQMSGTTAGLTGEKAVAVTNFKKADEQLSKWVLDPHKTTLELSDLKVLHELLCAGLKNNNGKIGDFRTEGKEMQWANHDYVCSIFVKGEMELFCEWLKIEMEKCRKGQANPVLLAAQAYQRLTSIHPFIDGNGRTSRMVMDFILQKFGLPPAAMQDPKAAVFADLSDEENLPQEEVVNKVKIGVCIACKTLKLKSPFVTSLDTMLAQEFKRLLKDPSIRQEGPEIAYDLELKLLKLFGLMAPTEQDEMFNHILHLVVDKKNTNKKAQLYLFNLLRQMLEASEAPFNLKVVQCICQLLPDNQNPALVELLEKIVSRLDVADRKTSINLIVQIMTSTKVDRSIVDALESKLIRIFSQLPQKEQESLAAEYERTTLRGTFHSYLQSARKSPTMEDFD